MTRKNRFERISFVCDENETLADDNCCLLDLTKERKSSSSSCIDSMEFPDFLSHHPSLGCILYPYRADISTEVHNRMSLKWPTYFVCLT